MPTFATGMPVRVMRSVKSLEVAQGNMRRICHQLADMNHVGRRFLPFIQNIVEFERHAMLLMLEDLMRCQHGLAPGRRLTAKGQYARSKPPTSLFSSLTCSPAGSDSREIPFLEPLRTCRLGAVAQEPTALHLRASDPGHSAEDLDVHRRRQFERHQVIARAL